MNKKTRRAVKTISRIITIIGLPTIGILGWNMHLEQINLRNYTIEAKQAEIDFLKSTPRDVILKKYTKEKEEYENLVRQLNDTIKEKNRKLDSLGIKTVAFLSDSLEHPVLALLKQGNFDSISEYSYDSNSGFWFMKDFSDTNSTAVSEWEQLGGTTFTLNESISYEKNLPYSIAAWEFLKSDDQQQEWQVVDEYYVKRMSEVLEKYSKNK